MILFRPMGMEELRLVYQSGMRSFSPRLPEQPIFYPVLTIDYAQRIAKEWNTKSGSAAGYVTRFAVPDEYAARFQMGADPYMISIRYAERVSGCLLHDGIVCPRGHRLRAEAEVLLRRQVA